MRLALQPLTLATLSFTLKEVRLARKVLAELDRLKKELDEAKQWQEVELKNFQAKASRIMKRR
jgi:hypothetical protein